MTDTCSCTAFGHCERRGVFISPVHFARCQQGHCALIDSLYLTVAPQVEDFNHRRNSAEPLAKKTSDEPVGTALANRITRFLDVKGTGGCGCQKLAEEMNNGGIAWVEKNKATIVDQLVQNRDILVAAIASEGVIASMLGWAANTSLGDAALRAGAEWMVDQAISDVRKEKAARPTRIIRGVSESETTEYNVAPGTWESNVRHLTYHIWPTIQHDGWKWNLDQLAKRWSLFNGKKIMAVVFDNRSHPASAVTEYVAGLGMKFDNVLVIPNNAKLREVITWLPMLSILNPAGAGPDEVVFAAHAKGVRHGEYENHLRDWADLIYRSCLDDWPTVNQQLSQFLATGSFKRYGTFSTPGNKRWHYSGTFFWWRLAEIGKRDWTKVDQQFFGSESWIGHQCYRNETGCLFSDDTQDLYQPDYWRDTVRPAWVEYVKEHRL